MFGMQETHQLIISSLFGLFVQQHKTFVLQPFHFSFNILNGKSYMVHAFTFLFYKFCNYTLRVGAFQQLNLIRAVLEKAVLTFSLSTVSVL